jgi:ARG/rhodanese/phosphatase superfamily protein
MSKKRLIAFALAAALAGSIFVLSGATHGLAGTQVSGYRVLAPISRGNLTIFPVVADVTHDTRGFLTLDEGLRSGEVVITERGAIPPLMRQRPIIIPPRDRPEVNRLLLINNSDQALILLAGEIVTGGKQDRVLGKDALVPPKSDPIDLSVYCVEPGRWVERADRFGGFKFQMAQPSVRRSAMVDKNQQTVWAQVQSSAKPMAALVSPPAARAVESTSSYAGVVGNQEVKRRIEAVAAPLERSYEGLLGELRQRSAVGVVVAVNGNIIWADVFASTSLLEKYWPKLVRSYAAEAITKPAEAGHPDVKAAQAFLDEFEGRRETVESEPGVYRRTEITGDSFSAFELTSLLPHTGYDIHVAKMAH